MNLWESLNEGTWLIINKTTGRNAAKTDMEEQNYRNWTCEWRTVRSEHPKNKIYHCLKVSLKLKPINNQLKSVIIRRLKCANH